MYNYWTTLVEFNGHPNGAPNKLRKLMVLTEFWLLYKIDNNYHHT